MRKRERDDTPIKESTAATVAAVRTEAASNETTINMYHTMVDLVRQRTPGVAPMPRLRGEIKLLYTDFTVREIDPQTNEPLFLTELNVPEAIKDPATEQGETAAVVDNSPESIRQHFAELGLTAEEFDAIIQFAKEPSRQTPVLISAPMTDKEKRTKFHQAVKTALGPKYDSTTLEGQIMKIAYVGAKGSARGGGGSRGGWGSKKAPWPQGRPEHLHFTVYKENIDSTSMLRQLATKIGVPQKALMFGGTKDKRGVTLQKVSSHKVTAEKVAAANNARGGFGRNCTVKCGNFQYLDGPLRLGEVKGNHFEIICRLDEENNTGSGGEAAMKNRLEATVQVLGEHGFINYFGPQRFGTTSIATSTIGCALLSADYKRVVELVLQSKAEIAPPAVDSLQLFQAGEHMKALEAMPYFCHAERDMLRALTACENNFEGAVVALPRPMSMLYCHSVQSLVWNEFASRRMAFDPLHVRVGDLVFPSSTTIGSELGGEEDEGGDDSKVEKALPTVHCVTAEDIASNRYSMADVLIPVVGPDTELVFPAVEGAKIDRSATEEYLAALGASPLLNASNHLTKRFHFHGTYRRLVLIPRNLSSSVISFSEPRQQLVTTDWMRLQGETLQTAETNEPRPLLAARLCFTLGPGSYATSLLRECFALKGRAEQEAAAAAAKEEGKAAEGSSAP